MASAPGSEIDALIELALREDVGNGDWTTLWTVDGGAEAEALIVAKEKLVSAGASVARRVFLTVDPDLEVDVLAAEGTRVDPGVAVLRVRGAARSILTAERVALNFFARLSGVATLTRAFVEAVDGLRARIVDTRKTTPGWRVLEKWAVRVGGGENHRMGLDAMILIKDNHILAAGGIREAVLRAKRQNADGLPIEVEVSRVEEIEQLRDLSVDRILLDNMEESEIREVVSRVSEWSGPRPELEASGNMTLGRVRAVAETGVDWISVGALTHSSRSVDFSLGLTLLSDGSGRREGGPVEVP